eukprot:scaffold12512_cov48-Attheya_sp.AAC.7
MGWRTARRGMQWQLGVAGSTQALWQASLRHHSGILAGSEQALWHDMALHGMAGMLPHGMTA